MNPDATGLWAGYLASAFERVATKLDSEPVHAVTLISPGWNADLRGTWPDVETVMREVRGWLAPFGYLVQIQVGFRRIYELRQTGEPRFSHYRYRYDEFACLHAHGIVFGDRDDIEQQLANMPRAFGASGGDVRELYDAHGWFQYSTSDPRLIETRVKRALKRGNWSRIAAMPLHLGVTLINYLDGRTLPELCLAKGRGARILKRAVRLAERCGYEPPPCD